MHLFSWFANCHITLKEEEEEEEEEEEDHCVLLSFLSGMCCFFSIIRYSYVYYVLGGN